MERYKLDISFENNRLDIEVSDKKYNNSIYNISFSFPIQQEDIFTNERERLYQYLKKQDILTYEQTCIDTLDWITKCIERNLWNTYLKE